MEQFKASETAILTAVQRAAHQLLDDTPKILRDPLAVGLVPGSSEQEIHQSSEDHLQPMRKRTRSGIILRSRIVEDKLAEAIQEGAEQYLILGAGFDTFAFRRPDNLRHIQVFEVDHPATQALKIDLLRKARLDPVDCVTFCPIDFEQVSLTEGLRGSAFQSNIPTFVSWLGVTMYLTRSAIEETLRFVLTLPSLSRILFTFFQPPDSLENSAVREQTASLVELAAAHGEPMISLFTPDELEDWLLGLGFSRVEHLTHQQSEARYFQGRTDGLTAHTAGHNICAYV